MPTDDTHLIWLDLEMTGLDPDRDRIIEIATLVTDTRLEPLAEGPVIAIYQPEEVLAGMDDWNQRHHGASGLLDRVRASTSDAAAAEDTRTTGKLLAHYGIRTPMIAYHEHNKLTRIGTVLERLAAGDVALVSDAGSPGLNDPGYELARAALAAGYEVSPIPGPCAPIAALTASGLPTDSFVYVGYLPRRSGQRKALLADLVRERRTLIALETPHRLMESLEDILAVLGDRPLAVARELTKIHEEFVRGSVTDARKHFRGHPPLGEITLVIGGAVESEKWGEAQVRSALAREANRGLPASELAEEIAAQAGWNKRDVYKLIHS